MKISKIKELGLWTESKTTTSLKGISELEDLGYNLFYTGKNADLYTCPCEDAKVLLVRSDRCSVFDIPLNLEIEKKGISQTRISFNGAKFANNLGIKTAIIDENVPVSLNIYSRCQIMELCRPLEKEINNSIVQFEFIFRNYLTGSLYEALQNGLDPYFLRLPSTLKRWYKFNIPLFTPTTKGLKDKPLNSKKIREYFPEIIDKLEELFIKFSSYALDNDIVVVDTKFEVFINSKGQWVLGDEILTPESSRFISYINFKKQNYISMDKQILRDFATKNSWKQKAKTLKTGNKLNVKVPNSIKQSILNNYKLINKKLSN
jgi:phosphoribosylaminoimidazole-succinocarboxamide synthase